MHPFSHSVNYAFRALALLAGAEGELVMVDALAARTGAPGPFLGKVLQALQKEGFVASRRGRKGGFRLVGQGARIPLAAVVDALDGVAWRASCLLGQAACSGRPSCAAWACCKEVRQKVTAEMNRLSVQDLWDIQKDPP